MRFTLFAVGSRGDAEPFCSLAHRLEQAGHGVDLFLQSDMIHLAPATVSGSSIIRVHTIPFTMMDFYKFSTAPSHGANGDEIERFVGVIADVVGELVLPEWRRVHETIVNGCNAMVVSSLARSLAFAISETTGVPTYLIHLQPLAATDLFPQYRDVQTAVAAIQKAQASLDGNEDTACNEMYAETYWDAERMQFNFLEDRVNELYGQLGLPPLTFGRMATMLSGRHPNVHIVNAFDNQIIPMISTIVPPKGVTLEGNNIDDDVICRLHQLGALADDYLPPGYVPPQNLVQFLDCCGSEKPICIGFGSMPVGVAEQVHMAVKKLAEQHLSVVLVGDALAWSGDTGVKQDNKGCRHVFHVSSIPYAWLLPRCSTMVSHGGAGAIHACFRAGLPLVLAPLFGDQLFWAALLSSMLIATVVDGGLAGLTADTLVSAIIEGLTPDRIGRAAVVSAQIQSERSGCEELVSILTTDGNVADGSYPRETEKY